MLSAGSHQNRTPFVSLHTVSRMVPDGRGGAREIVFQDTYGTYLQYYRLDGNIQVPCGMFGFTFAHAFDVDLRSWPFSSGAPDLQMWLWQDNDGDGEMKPAEFTDLTDNNVSASWHALGSSIDPDGSVWKRATIGGYCTRTNHSLQCHGDVDPVSGRCKQSAAYCKRCECTALNFCNVSTCLERAPLKQYLINFPMTGMNEHGCPVYGTAKAGWWATDLVWEWPPAPFNETIMGPAKEFPPGSGKYIRTGMCHQDDLRSAWCQGRLQYVSATDTMFVSDFTNAEADSHNWPIGESAGSKVCRFDHFKASGPKAVPKPSMCYDLPYWHNTSGAAPVAANLTHSLDVTGHCVFVVLMSGGVDTNSSLLGATDGGGVLVVNSATTGELIGYVNPNRNTFMGVAGGPDVPYAVTTKKLQDGRLVVLVEDDLFQHVAATVIDTGVC